MEKLIKLLQEFWPEVIAIIFASCISIFYTYIKQTSIRVFKYCFGHMHFRGKCLYETTIKQSLEGIRSELNPKDGLSIRDAIKNIEHELHPNGGGSLRDAINRIDVKVTRVTNKLNTIQTSTEMMSDTLNICRWAADASGNVVFVNRPLKKLLGIVDDDFCLGHGWLTNTIHPDDRERVEREWDKVVHDKSEYHNTHRAVNMITGDVITVTRNARVILDENNEPNGWAGVLTPQK